MDEAERRIAQRRRPAGLTVAPVRAAAADVGRDEDREFGGLRNRQRTGRLGRHGRGSVRQACIGSYAIRVSGH